MRQVRPWYLDPFVPQLLRLEDRRVLDVSAAYSSVAGQLDLAIAGSSESASIAVVDGILSIRDSHQQEVAIPIDGGNPAPVNASQVRSIHIVGDSAAGQSVSVDSPLALPGGFTVDSSVEIAVIRADLTRVSLGPVKIDAGQIELGADIEASGQSISLAGPVRLTGDVRLTAVDVTFSATVDAAANTSQSAVLRVESSGVTRFLGDVGSDSPVARLETDTAGRTELHGNITASGNTIVFADPVVLFNDVVISDAGLGGITFGNAVDSATGQHASLTLAASSGAIRFNGNLGAGGSGDARLGALTVQSAAAGVVFGDLGTVSQIRLAGALDLGVANSAIGGAGIVLRGDSNGVMLSAEGTVRMNGPVVLGSDVQIVTGGHNLRFTANAPIDSQANQAHSLTLNAASGAVFLNADVGSTASLRGLTVVRADAGIRFGETDTKSGDTGPVNQIRSVDTVVLGLGGNAIAGGIEFQAEPGHVFQLSTTGDDVSVNGPIILRSDLRIDTGTGPGDIRFRGGPIDGETAGSHQLLLQAGAGSVAFSSDLGAVQPLGSLQVERADGGVTFGTSDIASGGLGPVTNVVVRGTIDIGIGSHLISGTGIILNGGSGGVLRVSSLVGDVRWNGPVTLDSNVQLTAGGNITFTNDAPINSRAGESQSLSIEAVSGAVAFHEDLGRESSLESLTVSVARDGILLGGAVTEIPGSGGSGPVEMVRVNRDLILGSVNLVGGFGIVLSGSATSPQVLSALTGAVRINGPVTLQTDVEIAAAANLIFSSSSPINSAPGRASGLTLGAANGRVEFNHNLGERQSLGALTIMRAPQGVHFGASDQPSTGPTGTGPVTRIATEQTIDIGVGTNGIGGLGVVFNGGNSPVSVTTTGDTIRLNGPIHLASDLVIDTGDGPGDILFTSAATLNSRDNQAGTTVLERNHLFLDAGRGQIRFNADIGVIQPLNTLTVDRAGGGVVFGGGDTMTVGGSGPVTRIRTAGAVDLGSGTALEDVVGQVVFNGGRDTLVMETEGQDIRINGPSILQSDLQLSTGQASGNLLFTANAPINGEAGELRSLEVMLRGGSARFSAAVGDAHRLGQVSLRTVHDADFEKSVTVTRIAQVAGTGHTEFHDAVSTQDTARAGLELDGVAFTFDAPVRATGDGRVTIQHSGLLDVNSGADFRIDGAFVESGGGSVEWGTILATSGDSIRFNSPLKLTDGAIRPTLFSTVADGQGAGANLQFAATVDGQTAGTESITINVGTAGDARFDAAAGSTTPLGVVTLVQSRDVTFQSLSATRVVQLDGSGTTTFRGPAILNHATLAALDLHTDVIRFEQTVTTTGLGSFDLQPNSSLVQLPAANLNLSGPFRQIGPAAVELAAGIVTSNDAITFDGPVSLAGDVTLDTGAGNSAVRFASAVNSQGILPLDLTLRVDQGTVHFMGAVGITNRLDHLQIDSASDVLLANDVRVGSLRQATGFGTTTVNGLATIEDVGGIRIETENVIINGGIDARGSTSPVSLIAAVDLSVAGQITAEAAPIELSAGRDITFDERSSILSSTGPISLSADQNLAGRGGILMHDGSLIHSQTGALTVAAHDDIVIGRMISLSPVMVTSRGGAILDGGDSLGSNLVAPAIQLRAARGIGSAALGTGKGSIPANPLETEVTVLAASNAFVGGIQIANQLATDLSIGTVDGLQGLSNTGAGSIDVTNGGTLRVEQPVLNRGGGDTRIRSGFPGDLVVLAPIQNTGGDGSILLFAGGDLVIRDSLPEPPGLIENPPGPEQFFEILVSGEGAVRGQAAREVLIDDGESQFVIVHTKTGQITNAAPVVDVLVVDQGGSDIDEQGRGVIKVTFGDAVHLETNYHIQITWGDGEIENYPIPGTIHPLRLPGNLDSRYVSGEASDLGSPESGVYFFSHRYFQHPNVDDPSRPIPIRVEVRYDARPSGFLAEDDGVTGTASAVFNGINFLNRAGNQIFSFHDDFFSVPGSGNFAFIKIVESVIVPVEPRTIAVDLPAQATIQFTSSVGIRGDFRTESNELVAAEEYRLFVTVVDDVTGTESPDRIDLNLKYLSDPLSLFRTRVFPNGHYRIYLEEVRTRRVRLILDIHVFNGKVVPPNFRDGAAEKQPDVDEPAAAPPRRRIIPGTLRNQMPASASPRLTRR